MSKQSTLLAVLTLPFYWHLAVAYELDTHARLTDSAYQQSVLGAGSVYETMGLDITTDNLLGDTYYDLSSQNVIERGKKDYEKKRMPNKGKVDKDTIKGMAHARCHSRR